MKTDELLALTPAQEKAWRKFKKAVAEFEAAGGKFYTALETVHAYNGEYVTDISNDSSQYLAPDACMDYIQNMGFSGFADDTHYIHLTDEGEALIEGE